MSLFMALPRSQMTDGSSGTLTRYRPVLKESVSRINAWHRNLSRIIFLPNMIHVRLQCNKEPMVQFNFIKFYPHIKTYWKLQSNSQQLWHIIFALNGIAKTRFVWINIPKNLLHYISFLSQWVKIGRLLYTCMIIGIHLEILHGYIGSLNKVLKY